MQVIFRLKEYTNAMICRKPSGEELTTMEESNVYCSLGGLLNGKD